MGYLLKEALKTLCGVNQWSYAVFWKFGYQNPKLLIWEDCYYEHSLSCSELLGLSGSENPGTGFCGYNASWASVENETLQCNLQATDKVHLLVNKMMMDSQVVISGERLVGRAAFSGCHQWILSENCHREAHPPEVLKELCRQFSAGMQTVAVIPVLPHGVVQFGSFLTIPERVGFVNDVVSLVLQLALVPGVFPSEDHAGKEQAAKIGIPAYLGNTNASLLKSSNYVACSGQVFMADGQTTFPMVGEIQNELRTNVAAFQASVSSPSHQRPQETRIAQALKLGFSSSNQLINRVAKAEVIPLNSEMLMNRNAPLYKSSLSGANHCTLSCTEQKNLSDTGNQNHFGTPSMSASILMPAVRTDSIGDHGLCQGVPSKIKPVSGVHSTNGNICPDKVDSVELKDVNFSKWEALKSDSVDVLTANSVLAYSASSSLDHTHNKLAQNGDHLSMAEVLPGFVGNDNRQKFGGQIPLVNSTENHDTYVQPESGDDLFDVLGPDYKNKVLRSCWDDLSSNESAWKRNSWDEHILPSKKSRTWSEMYSSGQGNTDSGIFSSSGDDNLLEAVVLQVCHSAKLSMDDSVSCKTGLTSTSSSSVPNTSLPYDRSEASAIIKGELFGIPKQPPKAGALNSCSERNNVSFKEESGTYSQGSSFYESQISSWIEKDQKEKQNNSVSTGYSKKPHEMSKPTRKRLKPGENPRPRPKDRQMIQDRVKELREIVPNGAKCSIDSLLERTIKHMLFLQSVMKHADKLKQTGESKLMSKDSGSLSKDNFEGGVTWAYEVGTQSTVCPIRVEDLNQPRQMLVEMLCEERGLFLEIADIIRGLGLTILKGVMETRNDKIWSRFTVEANRDITRMEVFISLVHLLEQTTKPDGVQPNGVSSDNLMAQQLHTPGISPNFSDPH